MEIQVGEYVRLDDGTIGKFVIKQHIYMVETQNRAIGFDIEKDVVKHSFNIIDLIEVGDYINGEELTQVRYDLFINSDFGKEQYAKHIKSIVTKEQFESIKYEV